MRLDDRRPGFFGKLPCKGDFVTRRLSRDFREGWQLWLNAVLSRSREILGDNWQEIYLTSPVWRFALARGVFGPCAAVGVMLPSADRVGRCYPFAAVAMIEGLATLESLVSADAGWFDAVEAHVFDALEDDADLDRFDAGLSDLGQPCLGMADRGQYRKLPCRGPIADLTMTDLAPVPERARCCFWGQGSERAAPSFLAAGDLPEGELFTAMLDGDWSGHGWFDEEAG
jgi:type VI secretion system protein ImpM